MEEKLTYKEMWEALKKRIQFSIDILIYDSNNRDNRKNNGEIT